MKPRRVVIQLECETDAKVSDIRKAKWAHLRLKDERGVNVELTEAPRVNVIRAKPTARKGKAKR